jgi:DNA repair protein RAD5
MMDCWWNAATENQAIDRVHRLGQEKMVYVKHFIVSFFPCFSAIFVGLSDIMRQIKNTIEGRILQIQKRKTALVKEAFRGTGGKTDSDSIENLRIMFGDD